MVLQKTTLSILALITAQLVTGQNKNDSISYLSFCTPNIVGLPRSKGIVVKYELLPHYTFRSTAQTASYSNANAGVSRNGRMDIKVKIPIVNKPGLTIIGGAHYFQEQFHFTNPSKADYPVYQSLEDRSLKSAGISLYVIKPTKHNTYFLLRASADLSGDLSDRSIGANELLKYSIAPMYGWKRNENLSYAIGLAYGYTFGRPSLYPLFSYNKNFTKKWGIESLLPVSVKLRYTPNIKTIWYASADISGASYRLSNKIPGLGAIDKPHIHRSEIKTTITMERELHDWLWFSAEVGFRQNLQFNLTNSPGRRSDVLIKNKLSGAPIFGLSLFMVPPKKCRNTISNQVFYNCNTL